MNRKVITIALIMLMSAALIFASAYSVQGQSLGLYIYQVVPQDGVYPITSGNVSQAITVQGTIYVSNGPYLVYFGEKLVDNGTSSGFYVASNFTIPEVTAGIYTITLVDVTASMNATKDFTVNAAYKVQPVLPEAPEQLQVGANVVLNVSITGGIPNTTHTANITIVPPAALNSAYSQLVSLTTSASGTAYAQITYPSSNFTPSGSTTIYTGTYIAYFNQTANLGQSTFNLGITDKTEYHRQETITITSVGYQAGQTATLTIKNEANVTLLTQTVTATSQGVIHETWTIPSTAALGTYNVTITPQGTAKTIVDSQTFTLLGYPVTFRALNLAGDVVSDIVIEVYDAENNLYYNATTHPFGPAVINLEAGTYTVSAYWNDIKVGERQISLTGTDSFDITCKLTNLKVSVKAMQGNQQVAVPYVNLAITIKFGTGATQISTITGQTDLSGAFILNSTLPNAQYVIEASKYNTVFNAGNDTVNNLSEQAHNQVNIICPIQTLSLKTVDSNYTALPNTRVELVEQGSGVFYSVTTDNSGSAQLQVIFGQYRAKVYSSDNFLLNETTINVFSNTQSQIRCVLYDLKLTVKVVDYFGNPLSGVNVQISRIGTATRTAITQSDGTATFEGIVGGDYTVTAYLPNNDNSYVSTTIQVTSPVEARLSMANFVSLGSLTVGISVFATIIILALVAVLIAVIVLYRKARRKLLK